MRILHVDDEPDICEIGALALALDPDFEVRTCLSGEQALGEAAAWRPDLILLDVMMPRMDGLATLKALRDDSATKRTPVIFLTARAQANEIGKLSACGVLGVIPKPFDAMTLARDVRAMLPR